MASPPRGSYATDEEWQRRIQHDGYQRNPYPWTPEMTNDYDRYKDANHQHGHDERAYFREREQREGYVKRARQLADPPRVANNPRDIWCPRNLTREDHEHLGPMASTWNGSATEHRDLRREFDHKYPQAYRSTASKKTHQDEAKRANNSVRRSREYMDEHIRYGGQFMIADPYDNYDVGTGGSYHPGPDKDNPRQRVTQQYR